LAIGKRTDAVLSNSYAKLRICGVVPHASRLPSGGIALRPHYSEHKRGFPIGLFAAA
jgi:hypothetical protein